MVVGVTNEAEALVRKTVADLGMKFAISMVQGNATDESYAVKGFPHSALVAPDGTIAWMGHPASMPQGQLEELLGKAVFVPPLPAKYAAINAEIAKKNFGKAAAAIDKELAKNDDDALKKARAAIDTLGTEKVESAKKSGEAGDYAGGADVLEDTAKQWKGLPAAEEAAKLLKDWKADKSIAAQMKGGDDMKKAEALEKMDDPAAKKKAYGMYLDIAKRLKDTPLGEKAKAAAERMKGG